MSRGNRVFDVGQKNQILSDQTMARSKYVLKMQFKNVEKADSKGLTQAMIEILHQM